MGSIFKVFRDGRGGKKRMIHIVIGTRPEIIKMSPIIKECQKRGTEFEIVHTGQHYSYEMDKVFFEQFQLPDPDYELDVGSGPHGEQTGKIMKYAERVWMKKRPSVVLVQGDTNTVIGVALAAVKLHIPVGHVEAGLRSFDRSMPEEINRIVADHVSDYLFAPNATSATNLGAEGVNPAKTHITGNTIVDAIRQNKPLLPTNELGDYFLATVHRAENTDTDRLEDIILGLTMVRDTFNIPVIFPVHPRTDKILKERKIKHGLTLVPPQDYLNFLCLEKYAKVILTDSGGVQEEACILGVPCVTLRDNTERPETLAVGANTLAGTEPLFILNETSKMVSSTKLWKHPFGDGHAAEKILDVLNG
jgi:UDP-N-acetylglucosamine 2-epimerase (non-hydrolysing)